MLLLFLPVLRFRDFRAKQPDALEYATEDSAAPSRTSVRSVPKIMVTVAEHTGPDLGLSQFQLFFSSIFTSFVLFTSFSWIRKFKKAWVTYAVSQLMEMAWPKLRSILQNAWFLMTVKVIKKKNNNQTKQNKNVKTENPSQTRGDWGDKITQCRVSARTGFWGRKMVLLGKEVKFKWGLGLR